MIDYTKPPISYTLPSSTRPAFYPIGFKIGFNPNPTLSLPNQPTKTNSLVNSSSSTLAFIGKSLASGTTPEQLPFLLMSRSLLESATLGSILAAGNNPNPEDIKTLLASSDPKMVEIGKRIESGLGPIAQRLMASADNEVAELGHLLSTNTSNSSSPKQPTNNLTSLLNHLIQQLLTQLSNSTKTYK